MQSINLIPQQEVQEQTQEKAVKLSTWLSIGFLVIIAGISGLIIYQTQTIDAQLKSLNDEIGSLRGQIGTMAQVEVSARNLDKKYTILKSTLSTRPYYSLLSQEILARSPSGIVIDSITLQKGTKLNISGHADNYITIASFTNNLVDTNFTGGDPTLKTLFTTVTLNSVSLEKSRNVVTFSINVDLNANLLAKK